MDPSPRPRWPLPKGAPPTGARGVVPVAALLALLVATCAPGPVAPSPPPRSPAPSAVPPPSPVPASPPGPPSPSSIPSPGIVPPPGPPCGEGDPDCLSLRVESQTARDLTRPVPCGGATSCLLRFDLFWPTGGHDLPEVVMIPGGPLPPGNRDSLWPLARDVAARGAVVITADYRSSPAYGGGVPTTFADVACAVAVARDEGPQVGGRPGGPVVLVAHSFGGFPAAVVALSPAPIPHPDCTAAADGRPDALVGIGGVYQLTDIGATFLEDFVGAPRTADPARWAAADPAVLVANPQARRIPVVLVVGEDDPVGRPAIAEGFAALLAAHGYPVTLTRVAGADHTAILEKLATVEAVLGALRAAAAPR